MWIPVWDGPRQLWVNEEHCYLENGELAFINESIPRPLPEWLETLPDSRVRMSSDDRHVAGCLLEHRSVGAPAEQVLAFYRHCIDQGGLEVQPDSATPGLPGRCCPGFSARNARDHFLVNVFPWRDLSFFTIYLTHHDRRRKSVSVPLQLIQTKPDGLTLWIANERRKCWVPTSAVSSTHPRGSPKPQVGKRRQPDVLPLSSVPSWLRYSIDARRPTVLTGYPNGRPIEEWSARILLPPFGNPYPIFEKWLAHFDACGLDATGASRSNYHLTVWQQGQMLSAQVAVGAENQGGISLLHAGEKSITARYVIRRSVSDNPSARSS